GPGQATDLPRVRGVLDPYVAARRQWQAHHAVLGLRPPRPAEIRCGNGLAQEWATAAEDQVRPPRLAASCQRDALLSRTAPSSPPGPDYFGPNATLDIRAQL